MDWLNKWLQEVSDSPAGSILLFLLAFAIRLGMDEHARRRAKTRAEKRRQPHRG